MRHETSLRIGWVCLLVVSVGILAFGLITAAVPGSGDKALMRADGLASVGLGLFGVLISVIPFRRREPWAWWALWFYPVFWTVHLVARLPPGKDHVHQVLFMVLSLVGLLITVNQFVTRRAAQPVSGAATE